MCIYLRIIVQNIPLIPKSILAEPTTTCRCKTSTSFYKICIRIKIR